MKKIIRVVASASSLDIFLKDQMVYLSQWYEIVGVASPGESHAKLRAEGIRTEEINIERPIRLWKDVKSLWQLYKFFFKEKPIMVHSITPKAGLLSMIAAWMARVPVRVHTFTGLLFPWKKGFLAQILKTTDRLTCIFATHINPEGQGVRQQLIDYHITWKKLPIIGNGNIHGVNLTLFSPHGKRDSVRKELGISLSSFVFIFVGRLVRDKGINELVYSFCQIQNIFPDTVLLLVGSDQGEHDFISPETKEKIRTSSNIYALGNRSDVPNMLEASDAFVFPSYREGFPNALLEAQALSLPCIATDICGCNEILHAGIQGWLIQPRDVESLYSAMMEILHMPNKSLRAMGKNARHHIEEKFSSEFVNEKLREFYQQII